MDLKEVKKIDLADGYGDNEEIFSISSEYLALTHNSCIKIHSLDVTDKEFELQGHSSPISQLTFSDSNILLSCSSDSLLSWNLSEARMSVNAGKKPLPVYVGVGLGSATFISTNKNIILMIVKKDIIVLDTSAGTTRYLEGHESNVVYCHLINKSKIISLSNDNNMKVWSLVEKKATTQFKLLSSAPFTSIYFDSDTLYLGSADGMLHVYEPNGGTRLKRINIENYLPNMERAFTPDSDDVVIYAQPKSRYLTQPDTNFTEDCNVSNSVLDIFRIVSKNGNGSETDSMSTFGPDVPKLELNVENVLIVILTSGIIQLNSLSLQLLTSTSFAHHTPALPLAYSVNSFLRSDSSILAYADLFYSEITVLELRKLATGKQSNISMVQKCIMTTTTPLLNLSQWKSPEKVIIPIKGTEKRKSKAKASGYSVSATSKKQEFFKPNTNIKPKPEIKKPPKKDPYVYPSTACRPKYLKNKLIVSDRKSPVQVLSYSKDSDLIVAGLADYSSVVLKLPLGNKSTPLVGHKGPLISAKWSSLSNLVITTAADRSSKIWDSTSGSIVIDLKYSDGNTQKCEKIEFKKDPIGGQFFYIDKFILLGHANELLLYKHHIERPTTTKRLIGRYRRICVSPLQHNLTSISACNSFYSTLVVCGLSDKSLAIYDFNQQEEALSIPSAHSRAPHFVSTVDGSKYVPHSAETYNLIMSCSVMDDVKLWDVRSGQCVKSFNKPNRVACIPSISTCVRYVAVPGEDQAVHMFDIRGGGGTVYKIQNENALSTVFSPKYPQLAVGSSTGTVTFYNDKG